MGRFVNHIFKNMEILNRIPWAAKNSVFMRLGELAEVANMSEKQRRSYDKDLKILRDSYNILEFAKKEARREGLQEGREEGRAEGVKEMAVEMLKKGMDIELVSEISKLSIDDVRKLRRQLPSA
jgi:predicted transposase/invertase (TIGR01784 family)